MAVYLKLFRMVNLSLGNAPLADHIYKDTCKHDTKMAGIDINSWASAAIDRGNWSSVVKADTKRGEDRRWTQLAERRDRRKQTYSNAAFASLQTMYVCRRCGGDCHDRIGFLSHIWRCIPPNWDSLRRKPLSSKTDGCHVTAWIYYYLNTYFRSTDYVSINVTLNCTQ